MTGTSAGPATGQAQVPTSAWAARWIYPASVAALVIAATLPIALFSLPPLVDYPAHLAREFILHDLLTTGRFSAMYRLHFAAIPNLGIEAIVLPLLFLGVPVDVAGRIFLCVIVVLLGLGIAGIHRALFRKASYVPLLALAYIYNPVFMYGFVNYLFGVALALIAFSWWLRLRNAPWTRTQPFLLLWATALFFCHLTAAGLFLGLVGSYELSLSLSPIQGEKRIAALSHLVTLMAAPVAAVAILYHLGPFGGGAPADTYSLKELMAGIPQRLNALPSYLSAYSRAADAISLIVLLGMVGTGLWFRRVCVAWPMVLPVLGLLAVYLIIPDSWAGTQYIAYRIPVIVLFLSLASVDIAWNRPLITAILVASLVLLRSGATVEAWAKANSAYRPMMEALEKLPPGSTIYVGVNYRQSFEPQLRLPWSHFAAYAAIRRGMFVADVWADPTQNWIVQTPHYKTLADLRPLNNRVDNSPRPAPGHDMYDPALVSGFDYLLAVQPELYQGPAAKQAHVIAQSGNGVLFSLHR